MTAPHGLGVAPAQPGTGSPGGRRGEDAAALGGTRQRRALGGEGGWSWLMDPGHRPRHRGGEGALLAGAAPGLGRLGQSLEGPCCAAQTGSVHTGIAGKLPEEILPVLCATERCIARGKEVAGSHGVNHVVLPSPPLTPGWREKLQQRCPRSKGPGFRLPVRRFVVGLGERKSQRLPETLLILLRRGLSFVRWIEAL